jgi:hypothetical protein
MQAIEELKKEFKKYFKIDSRHLEFISKFIIALILQRTVNLTKCANAMLGTSKEESNYKRIQRFFKNCPISKEEISKFVSSFFSEIESWKLAIDRTDWYFGNKVINILTVCIVNEGISFPIFWKILPKKGNSNTTERIEVMEKLIELFGVKKIRYILCDREFIGEEWFGYLIKTGIDFRIRVKENFKILNRRCESEHIKQLFKGLQIQEVRTLQRPILVCGHKLYISGMRANVKEYLIVVSPSYSEYALNDYAQRW